MPHSSTVPHVRRALLTPGLLVGFALTVMILIATLGIGLTNLRSVFESNEAVAHTFEVKANLEQLFARLIDAETGARGFVITGDARYLEPYDSALALIASEFDRLRGLAADNREQQGDLDRLWAAKDGKLAQLAEAVKRRRESGFAAAQAAVADPVGKQIMDELRVIVARMEAREDTVLVTRRAQAAQSYSVARATRLGTTGIALLVVVVLFVGTRRLGAERVRATETAEGLKVTLASIGDAVMTTDAAGRVTRLNPVAQALTGWSEDAAAGRPLHDVFVILNEETRQPVPSPVDRVLREGVIVGLANHTVLISRDGREIPIDDSAAPIRSEDGEMAGVIMVFRDVGERHRTERASRESEERLRITIASIGDAVLATDERGRITQLNPVGEALTGWREAEALGRPLGEVLVIVNETSREPAPNPVERVLRDGVVAGLANHTVLFSKTGREIPIDDSAAPVRAADGRLLGAVMVFRDITERRQIEAERAALLEAERAARRETEVAVQQLQSALRAGRMGTWQYTIGTGEVRWSEALEEMHGFKPGTFAGTFEAFRNEIHPEDRDRVLEAIRTALDERRDHHVEYRIVRADGAIGWVEGVGQVVCDEHGRPESILGVCADITGRAQILAREQAARGEMERASRMKDEFLAVLSHELRTPLNAVVGYAHLLSSGALTPERTNHALEAIQRNAQAQSRLLESLLDLSRVMAGKLELNLEQVDLSKVLELAVDVVRPQAEAKRITLEVVPPSRDVTLVGDASRLQQVFWNLLSNSVKFTPAGGRVGILSVDAGANVHVLVTDSGQGINADFLPYVFDRFSQADSHKARSTTGLGLGLALVREMVQAHGGSVIAESQGEGRGSTFTVTLPVSIGMAMPAPQQRPASAVGESESLPPIEVLIVDDEADVRELLALLLESRGAVTRSVSSANEAIEAISQRRPHVLLADLRMPGEDGYSLIQRVRAREREQRERRLPAIAVTAYASTRDRDQALAAGYDAHLAKPVEPAELARAVAGVTRGFRRNHAPV